VGSTKDLKPASFIEVRRTAISLIEKNSGERAGGPPSRVACAAGDSYKRRSKTLGRWVEPLRIKSRFEAMERNPWCYCSTAYI
jgi:hypothetical protein